MAKLPSLIVTSTLLASSAQANDVIPSVGLHFVLHFGDGLKPGIGVDLRVTNVEREICAERGSGFGAFAQYTWLYHGGSRVAAGVHGGASDNDPRYDFELGWTYGWSDELSAHGLQLGVTYPVWPFDPALRGAVLFTPEHGPLVEGTLALGLRLPGMFGEGLSGCDVGRPFRVDGDKRFGPVAFGPRRHLGTGDPRWLDDAREEAASVPAFLMLARDLDRLGAHRLACRARVAAREEVTHARLCNALAGRDLGRRVRALPPCLVPTDTDVTRLVLESWLDGCVGEGTAAREASLEHATTRDPEVRATLAQIAHDEASHAELAWAVLAHLVPSASRATRDALAHAITTTTAHDDVHATTLTHARRRAHRLNYY